MRINKRPVRAVIFLGKTMPKEKIEGALSGLQLYAHGLLTVSYYRVSRETVNVDSDCLLANEKNRSNSWFF